MVYTEMTMPRQPTSAIAMMIDLSAVAIAEANGGDVRTDPSEARCGGIEVPCKTDRTHVRRRS
jgi:hypothetical protein